MEGDKVLGMQLYIHRAMCMCVVEIYGSYTCFSKSHDLLLSWLHVKVPSVCFPTTGVLRLIQL